MWYFTVLKLSSWMHWLFGTIISLFFLMLNVFVLFPLLFIFPLKTCIYSHHSKSNSLQSFNQRLMGIHDWYTFLHIYKDIKAEQPELCFILFLTCVLVRFIMKHKVNLYSVLTLINTVFSCFGNFLIWSLLLREETIKIMVSFSFWWYWLIVCTHHLVGMKLLGKITSWK